MKPIRPEPDYAGFYIPADLRAYRVASGVTQRALAFELGGTVTSVSTLEGRPCRTKPATALRYMDAVDAVVANGERPFQDDPKRVHGLYQTYVNWGCRCEKCRVAWRTYFNNRMATQRAAMDAAVKDGAS